MKNAYKNASTKPEGKRLFQGQFMDMRIVSTLMDQS
jgi:hypothetical protein